MHPREDTPGRRPAQILEAGSWLLAGEFWCLLRSRAGDTGSGGHVFRPGFCPLLYEVEHTLRRAAVEPSRAHGPELRTCLSGSESSTGHSTRVRNGVFPAIPVNKAVTVIIHFGLPNVNF